MHHQLAPSASAVEMRLQYRCRCKIEFGVGLEWAVTAKAVTASELVAGITAFEQGCRFDRWKCHRWRESLGRLGKSFERQGSVSWHATVVGEKLNDGDRYRASSVNLNPAF
jgi:hypothetical protein